MNTPRRQDLVPTERNGALDTYRDNLDAVLARLNGTRRRAAVLSAPPLGGPGSRAGGRRDLPLAEIEQHGVGVLAAVHDPVTFRAVKLGGGVGTFDAEADVTQPASTRGVGEAAQ